MRFADFRLEMTDFPKTGAAQSETEQLNKLLELELAQKRARWKQTGDRTKSIRAAGFAFLFVLIVGCLIAAYFGFTRVNEQRANPAPPSTIDH